MILNPTRGSFLLNPFVHLTWMLLFGSMAKFCTGVSNLHPGYPISDLSPNCFSLALPILLISNLHHFQDT